MVDDHEIQRVAGLSTPLISWLIILQLTILRLILPDHIGNSLLTPGSRSPME